MPSDGTVDTVLVREAFSFCPSLRLQTRSSHPSNSGQHSRCAQLGRQEDFRHQPFHSLFQHSAESACNETQRIRKIKKERAIYGDRSKTLLDWTRNMAGGGRQEPKQGFYLLDK